jgi:hypothetical protein
LVGRQNLAQDQRDLVNTLDVGRGAVIGVGQRASDVSAFAAGYPDMLSTRLAISPPDNRRTASKSQDGGSFRSGGCFAAADGSPDKVLREFGGVR